MLDPEIDAIGKCHELFKDLDDDSKIRVIQWLISKFQLNPQTQTWTKTTQQTPTNSQNALKILPLVDGDGENSNGDIVPEIIEPKIKTIESFSTVADFFAETSPSVDWDKALVVATYLQVKNGLTDFTSFEVNKELKNLGHPSGNITVAFATCIEKKPQLILQLRKTGNLRQGKKKYKVSGEGIKYVQGLLKKVSSEAG